MASKRNRSPDVPSPEDRLSREERIKLHEDRLYYNDPYVKHGQLIDRLNIALGLLSNQPGPKVEQVIRETAGIVFLTKPPYQ